MRTALFSRVSTTDKGQDTTNQLVQMREWCEKNGHEVVQVYEEHVSGSGLKKRPVFEQMFVDAKAGKFEQLIFWSLDRFSRAGVLATLQHLERLDAAKVCWKSLTEQYLDSCGVFRDAVLAILAAIAKQERLRISERVKAGLDVARAQGRVGGRRPVERDASMLKRVQELRAQGFSFRQIVAETGLPKTSAHRLLSGV